MSTQQVIPKCPAQNCQSTAFVVVRDEHLVDIYDNTIQFVCCKVCSTIAGVLPTHVEQ